MMSWWIARTGGFLSVTAPKVPRDLRRICGLTIGGFNNCLIGGDWNMAGL